jgi:hypothetical protein
MTQARDALNAHIQKMAQLRAAYEKARAPIADTSARIDAAKAELAAAEMAHDAALRAEGERFISGQDSTAETAEVSAKAGDLDRLRRLLAALVSQRTEQENVVRDRQMSISIADSGFETLLANVLLEVSEELQTELLDVGTKFSMAQAKAISLSDFAHDKKWHRLGETIAIKLNSMKMPSWQSSPRPDWRAFLIALESDPNTPVPVA